MEKASTPFPPIRAWWQDGHWGDRRWVWVGLPRRWKEGVVSGTSEEPAVTPFMQMRTYPWLGTFLKIFLKFIYRKREVGRNIKENH